MKSEVCRTTYSLPITKFNVTQLAHLQNVELRVVRIEKSTQQGKIASSPAKTLQN